jgi:hypothetical protein
VRTRFELRLLGVSAAFLIALVAGRDAHAFERQWHAGVDAGYAALFEGGASGFGGGAHAAYGLTDAFNVMLEVDVTRHPSASVTLGPDSAPKTFSLETVVSGGAGLAYTIDIARAVPYVGVLAAGYHLSDLSSISPGGQIALGLDYQLERNWAVGAQIRVHTIFTADAGTIAYMTTFLRLEYLWGF